MSSVAKHAGTKGQADLWCYSTPDQKSYIIATASAHAQGTNPMAVATGSWLESIDPGSAVLVGIAAAVKTKGIELGYVPFVEQVVGYGDIAIEAGKLTFRSSGFQVDAKMRVSAGQLRSAPEPYTAWQKECRSVINTIIPMINSMRAAKVVSPVPADVPDPHLIVGVMGSGPFLPSEIAETTISAGISVGGPIHPKLVSAEMEAHGFMEACHQKEVPACVLKGISDLGDAAKAALEEQSGGFFRAYACSNAVLALLHMLRQSPRPPRHEHEQSGMLRAKLSSGRQDKAKSVGDNLSELRQHTESVLDPIHSKILFKGNKIKVDRSAVLGRLRDALHRSPVAILTGVGGTGKTAVVKELYEEHKDSGAFFVFKGSEFNVASANELFGRYGSFTFADFLKEHESVGEKHIVIDSAEKLSDIEDQGAFQEFFSRMLKTGWRIIFTTRYSYLDDLKWQFVELFDSHSFEVLSVDNITETDLDLLGKKYGFPLPQNERFLELLLTPFYLNEYLQS
jgi:hypothetical protein